MNRQLITYENGKTLLGGADSKWDIPPGIFHLKNQKEFDLNDFNITEMESKSNLTRRGNDVKWNDNGERIKETKKVVTGI